MDGIEIVLQVTYGELFLSQKTGMGDSLSFTMTVDRRHWGDVSKRNGVWIGPEQLTEGQMRILGDIIDYELTRPRIKLKIEACFGNEVRPVYIFEKRADLFEITTYKGGYHRYLTTLQKADGRWTGSIEFGAWEDISGDDVLILGDIIDSLLLKPPGISI